MVQFILSAYVEAADLASFNINFTVPGSGYFQNITLKTKTSTGAHYAIGFGKVGPDNFARLPGVDGEFMAQQSRSTKTLQIWGPSQEVLDDGGLTQSPRVFYHRKARLYCKPDEVYSFRFESSGLSQDINFVLEADYVLYKNSQVKYFLNLNNLSNASDFAYKYGIPFDMADVILRLYGNVVPATAHKGILACRILDADDPYPDAATIIGGVGTFDGGILSTDEALPWSNVYTIHIGSADTGLSVFDRSFPVTKKIYSGDGLAFDILQTAGTFGDGDLELFAEIQGRTPFERKPRLRGHFMEGYIIVQAKEALIA